MRRSSASIRRTLVGTTLLAAVLAAPGAAQTTASTAPSTNATVNLIRLLIENKVITRAAGEALLAQAESEAARARAELARGDAERTMPGAVASAGAVAAGALPPPAPGTIRVPHIPEALRAQIRDDIKKDVLAQAQTEGWARPNEVPAWVKGIRLYGDVRFRSESVFYPEGNTDELIDFERFNEIGAIDINGNTNPTGFPILNTNVDRINRFRLRARVGLRAQLGEIGQAGFRIGSGDDRSPVSTNQLLGGGFGKKDIWLDQAFLTLTPTSWLTASFGRFANPFRNGNQLFDVTELMFDNDVNFDGAAVQVRADPWLSDGVRASLTGGAFPLGFADDNFPSNAVDKAGDGASKWLFSGKARVGWAIGDTGFDVEATAAYHSFKSVQGRLSAPCALFNGNEQCSTDQFQPEFLRKGNTLFFLRDIAPDPASPTNFAQSQRLGLAFDYDVLELKAQVKLPVGRGIEMLVEGEYIRNLAFRESDLCRFAPKGLPINNIIVVDPIAGAVAGTPGANFYTNPCTPDAAGRIAQFNGGDQGFLIRGVLGTPVPRKFGDWNFELAYRYIESDATLDALSDSDFHRGGTNAKGYTVGGSFGVGNNVTLTGRWLSATQISGPTLAIDVLQLDLVAAF